jgi:GNAT superfamily N-acetyltransferase/nitroimidazol reductase NimA-like FMN-containing flavoprotein (pyridoxamine 5'-phosphate oxidase superfamily)
LTQARYGFLGTEPLELRPMNFVLLDEKLYFHTAGPGTLASRAGQHAVFSCLESAAWLPSYWRDPELACPATTYYRSAVVRGKLSSVSCLELKAGVLEAFMQKYQPEGGYAPFTDKRYAGPLKALTVLEMDLDQASCKVKLGQHLPLKHKQRVYDGLVGRGDFAFARMMLEVNEDLPVVRDGWVTDAAILRSSDVWELLRHVYWAHKRSPESVAANLDSALLNLGWYADGVLRAYCRVTRVHPGTCWLYDVVVDPAVRGQGLGKKLIEEMLARVSDERIFLDTRDAMTLYEQYGWVEVNRIEGRSLMLLQR